MSVRVTLSQLEEMINKAKQNNDQKLLARLSRIYIKRRSEEEQKRQEFVEYTPQRFDPQETEKQLYGSIEQSLKGGLEKAESIQQEFADVPQEERVPTGMQFGPMGGVVSSTIGTEDAAPRSVGDVALYTAGEAVVPTAGEMFTAGLETFGKALGNVTPDQIEKPTVEAVRGLVYDVAQSEWFNDFLGAAEEGIEAVSEWLDLNPREARQLNSIMNVGFVSAPRAVGKTTGGVLDTLGTKASIKSSQALRDKKLKSIATMMTPETDKMSSQPNRGQKEVSSSGKVTWNPSKSEIEIYEELKRVPKLDPKAPFGFNVNRVEDQISALSERLEDNIRVNGNPEINKEFVTARVYATMDDLFDRPEFKAVGGKESIVKPYVEYLETLIRESDGTTLGLLQVRKDFDAFIKKAKPNALQGDVIASKDQAVQVLRQTLNNEVELMVSTAPTRLLLNKQRKLYQALDHLRPAADKQILGTIGRVTHAIRKNTGIAPPKTIQGIVGTGMLMGSLAAKPWFSSVATPLGVGGAGILGAQALASPQGRKAVSELVTGLGKAIKATSDPVELNMLKADRAILLQYLSDTSEPMPPLQSEEE